MPTPRRFRSFLSLLILVTASSLSAAENKLAVVNVVAELTDEGKKLPLASLEHPVIYFPLVGGYTERGAVAANDQTKPQRKILIQALLKSLEAQGYKRVADLVHPPSQLLIFHWGHAEPNGVTDFEEVEGIDSLGGYEMRSLVAGKRINEFRFPPEDMEIAAAASDSRYFIMVLAFDFEAAKKHEKKLLWLAKLGVPSIGVSADDAMLGLVRAGGPYFGRETDRAQQIEVTVGHIGRVEAGPTETKELLDSSVKDERKSNP